MADRRESRLRAHRKDSLHRLQKYLYDPIGSFHDHQMILTLRNHGLSLFRQAASAQEEIAREAEAADGDIDERIRKALPMAYGLLQETTEGLRRLASMASAERHHGIALRQVQDIDRIDWPRLLSRSQELDNPLAQRAIDDFTAALNSPLVSSSASSDEIYSILDRMRRDISELIDA